MTLAKDLQLKGLLGDFLNDDDISHADVKNEIREKNQISSYSPLKKYSSNAKLDKDLQLSCVAGQERDNLLNDSGFANPKVEKETRKMSLKPTSSPVKRYSPNAKVVKGATKIPLPSQFDGGLEALDAKVTLMMEKCNYMVLSGKIKTIVYVYSVHICAKCAERMVTHRQLEIN